MLGQDKAVWEKVAGDSVLTLLRNARIDGGDAIMVAALAAAATQDTNIDAVASDLRIAQDYKTYLANTETINLLMALNPGSDFATGWQVTLLRAQELGLNQLGTDATWTASLEAGGPGAVDPHTGVAFSAHETVRDANGIVVEEEFFHADGSQTDYQYYLNQTVELSGKTIKVINGATYVVRGSDNVIAGGHDVTLTVAGDRNGVTITGDDTHVALSGQANRVSIDNGTVTVAAGSSATVTGSGDVVTGGTGASLTLSGDEIAASVSRGAVTVAAGSAVFLTGDGSTVSAGAAAISGSPATPTRSPRRATACTRRWPDAATP